MSQGPAGCPDHADEDGLAPRRCRCSDNDALRILGEFESLYEGRIAEVEADPRPTTDAQRTELKLKIMTDWVKDLGEQNAMLVQTVHDLEQAAVCRVKLLENKLQATSTLISHNMSHSDKSEENLNVLSNRICHLASDQNDMQDKIDRLQSDIGSLLKLIKRGRTANNWDLDGITFYEVQPSDIQTPADCTCYQITNEIKNEESACDERDFKIKKLSEQLHNTEMKIEKLLHEQKCKESAHEMKSLEMRRESECLRNKLACLEKESSESRHALSLEVAQKHDTIMSLRNEIKNLETQLCDSVQSLRYKDKVMNQLREDLRKNSEKETKIKILENQVEELRMKLQTKDDMINEMKNYEKIKGDEVPNTKKKVRISEEHSEKLEDTSQNSFLENQKEIVHYLSNLKTSMEKDSEIIHNLKTEYETVLKSLKQTKNMHERDVSLANEKLLDIENCLSNYRTEVIEQDFSRDGVKEFIITIEKKIVFVEKLFQSNCKKCMEENVQSEIRDMISKVTLGIQKLSEIHENKHKITSSIRKIISENNKRCKRNSMNEEDQKAICAAISKQYRLMEEFRLCTVEVQAATEDLHEEVSEVISNLNSRHCKYIELNKMVCQVQDCLTKTREDMVEIIHHLELQDGERVRHSERITNNRIRLKDVKNEFNKTQTELSKCLNNVHNNIQQNNLLGYVEMNTCNDLLISVAEEVEQIVNDLQTFQTQGCSTLTTMNELKNQITVMELSVKDLKRKSENLLKENNVAEKCCEKNLKRLEKYECEVDNCHSKMQDVLESIVNVQDQMNEFGCIQESDDSHQSTNDTIKLKDELRRLYKECKELKQKGSQEDEINQKSLEWENKITDLQDQIHVLQNEIKCKQQLNIFLKQSIESLEKELISTRAKAEENRRCSSVESIDLKKKVIELENLLRVQKDVENSLKGLVINETHSKKSQHLDFVKDQHYGSPSKSILQGTNENISQLFKGLQDTIQTIKSGLQALTEKFKRLVPEGSPHPCDQNISEILAKHIGSIDYCFFEMEKIKAAWYSKDKLMENMDEIIRIQKDSITISQSEVEDVHKTLQERIETQEKTIAQVEKEKRHLSKQIEFQVQTISHLQNAVVEAKRTLDQLTQKSATDSLSKSRMIKSLRLYLSETRSQYSDCYGEASEQGALLERQRDAISALQRKIGHLERTELVHALLLHFIYYVLLYKYQEELDARNRQCAHVKSKVRELEVAKINLEKQCEHFKCKCREANGEMEKLRCGFEDSRKRFTLEKKREIDELLSENEDLKQQLQVYKLDFDIIEEEMKKVGVADHSVDSFRIELESLHAENQQFRYDVKNYTKIIDEYKCNNECLSKKLLELQQVKDASVEKYKGKIASLQKEIAYKHEQIKHLKCELTKNETLMGNLLHVIDDTKDKLYHSDMRFKNCSSDIDSYKDTVRAMQHHIDSLKISLKEKSDSYQELKDEYCLFKSKATVNEEKFRNESSSLRLKLRQAQNDYAEIQRCYDKSVQSLNKCKSQLAKLSAERRPPDDYQPSSSSTCHCDQLGGQRESKSEEVKKLTTELEDCQEKLKSLSDLQSKYHAMSNKCETFERSCQHQRNEVMLLEKKLACVNQKLQNCTDKNDELIRQNKSFEDSNNKCMAELEDIVLQLEDMQSSLVDLRTECDAKTQSLECVSSELVKMKISRSEVCEESKHVLNWLRRWMREQKLIATELREKLLRISSEKRVAASALKILKRTNRVLAKRLKFIRCRPPVVRQTVYYSSPASLAAKSPVRQRNGFHLYSQPKETSNGTYSYFRREYREDPVNNIAGQGDCTWFGTMEHLAKEVPRTPQINESTLSDQRVSDKDYGYQTSGSK